MTSSVQETAPLTTVARRPVLRRRVRGKMLVLLCAFYALAYIDRANISTAAPFIQSDLHLSDAQLGLVLSAFAIPYAFLQAAGGWLGDRVGARRMLAWLSGGWAAATVATGAAIGLGSLFGARLALGLAESAAFPTATTAMSRWLPAPLRATGQGLVHAASRVGSALTPLAVGALIAVSTWRTSFFVLGVFSLGWAVVWALYYRDRPREHAGVSPDELEELAHGEAAPERTTGTPWRDIVPALLPVAVVDFCYGWLLWVYITWLPTVFQSSFGLAVGAYALYTSLVLVAGAVGDLAGGQLADWLVLRCRTMRTARRVPLVIGLGGSLLALLPALLVHELMPVTLSLAAAYFLLELTNSTLWALPMDMVPEHSGAASGFMNTGYGLAGVLSPLVFGILMGASGGNWRIPLLLSVVLLAVGVLVALRIDPRRLGNGATAPAGDSRTSDLSVS
jgi:MFS family permease